MEENNENKNNTEEVKEETNLDIKKVVSYVNYFDYLSGSNKKCRQFNFKVEVTGGPIILTEHDTYKWIDLEDFVKYNKEICKWR